MNEENEKVNSGKPETPVQGAKAFDEITDGFYDLSRLYSAVPSKPVKAAKKPAISREDELRLRDEKRRELEMQAIKEDIERRYSIQLEEAQKKNDVVASEENTVPVSAHVIELDIDTNVSVDEEIERIDEIINASVKHKEKTEPKAKKRRKKEKKVKEKKPEPVAEYNPEDDNFVYASVYQLGEFVIRFISTAFKIIFGILGVPARALLRIFNNATASTKKKLKKSAYATVTEIANFRLEIKSAVRSLKKAVHHPKSLPGVIKHYVSKALKTHKKLLKTTANYLMPAAALLILVLTVSYWNNMTFALEVIYNGKSIGYIGSESVYLEAKEIVRQRLVTGGISTAETTENVTASIESDGLFADYKLTMVTVEQLNDAQAISDKIIENSVDNLTHACGIYIDGDFICAVKNESDAKTVFYNILEPYELEAEAEGSVVSFAQTIDYVQGLYRDDKDVMWDAPQLAGVIGGNKAEVVEYVVMDGDTIESVAEDNNVSESSLEKANPYYDWDDMREGDIIVLKEAVSFINIKKTVATTEIRDLEYDTVEKKDSSKYSGYRRVEQSGVDGVERVTKTKIYVDGELVDTQYNYETLVEAVDEIVVVGTKKYYDGVYIGSPSDSGFIWPAPSCHYVSSPYGWRSSGWHNGVDLVKSGGGASGTPVVASMSGTVEVVQRSGSGYGNMVLINHGNGYKTRYAHMISGSITVSVGDRVEAGQTIGRVGSTGNSTGPHLHFEVIYQGETQNPMRYIS